MRPDNVFGRLVRDDFGMAATRFMNELEIRIVEGHNFATVDLFDPGHARKVLAEFGRAFGRLPAGPAELAPEQERFLGQAVADLAQDGKVISVRLALFAEMVKGKPWTPATLRQVGGTEGVGVTFLEETFSAATAPLISASSIALFSSASNADSALLIRIKPGPRRRLCLPWPSPPPAAPGLISSSESLPSLFWSNVSRVVGAPASSSAEISLV
jgi:hypothetical protein